MRNYLLTVFMLVISFTTTAQVVDECGIENRAFAAGERLHYIVNYTWGPIWTDVGQATLSVNSSTRFENESLHLHAFGRSIKFYDWFFKVRDLYESWVDPITLRPIYFNRDINEGNYTKENEFHFDWEQNTIHARIRRRKRKNQFVAIPIENCTYDIVSAIYISRNLDFTNIKPNSAFPVTVALDRETYTVNYVFLGRELLDIKDIGTMRTMKFQVQLIAGDVFQEDQELYVWVTDDRNKIPVYIESPIKVGRVKVRIGGWEGLKHPMEALEE